MSEDLAPSFVHLQANDARTNGNIWLNRATDQARSCAIGQYKKSGASNDAPLWEDQDAHRSISVSTPSPKGCADVRESMGVTIGIPMGCVCRRAAWLSVGKNLQPTKTPQRWRGLWCEGGHHKARVQASFSAFCLELPPKLPPHLTAKYNTPVIGHCIGHPDFVA